MEPTLIIIKPDAVRSKLVGRILTRFEEKGFEITEITTLNADRQSMELHYREHKDEKWFDNHIDFMCSGKVVIAKLYGFDAIDIVRKMVGSRDKPGTIRGDFASGVTENACHASDSFDSFNYENHVWFPENFY